MHNNIQIQRTLRISSMQGIVNCLATCSTDDSDNKDGETTHGHWLEHHEHSASSGATLTKTETAAQSHADLPPWPVQSHEGPTKILTTQL